MEAQLRSALAAGGDALAAPADEQPMGRSDRFASPLHIYPAYSPDLSLTSAIRPG